MKDKLLLARYLFFGFVVICNAIICSVAVWNYSLVHANQTLQVDVYLIFLGAFGLAWIFTLMFIELLCSNPITTRVWFECVWIALLWLMELAGAAAITAIGPELQCARQAILFVYTLCVSQRVLVAFTWICTIILLFYLLFLVFIVVTHQRDDPTLWICSVRNLFRLTARQCLSSAPSSPSVPRFKKRVPLDIHYPHPVRPVPVPAYIHRAGLSSEYEIEHFQPVPAGAEQMDVESVLSLPEAVPIPPPKPAPAILRSSEAPRHPIPNSIGIPRELSSTIVYSGQTQPSIPAPRTTTTSPPPLGDWPRRDIMELPVQRKAPSSFDFPRRCTLPSSGRPPGQTHPLPDPPLSQPRTRRPSGPRLRTASGDITRPAPLDLSGISNYETANAAAQRDNVV
ncbi:hypothetical protein F5I97DRAFT_496613 [Phlebopus sp. FC_14]|nr:hypothetical protein F5I97DRAFT_496613 [Phlebopus sp. FC_14]